ncbi:MAG TPA: single-stranded DNA-binding protein [Opitutales bacterium]|nr:single-stranded DNA-binding protein [Opitutales bacterium]
MNQIIMTGNLTADIETREINANSGEQHLSKFTLACNEGERVVFIPVEAWNMPHLPEYLSKGSKVLISGALKQDHWETDAGDKRSRIVLTAYKVEFLDPAPEKPARAKQSSGTDKRRGKNYSRSRAA